MLSTPTVAFLAIDAVSPEGKQFLIELGIGTPYEIQQDWACPWAIRGIHDRERDILGVHSLQALCLALRLTASILQHFLDTGGKLMLYGENFCVDAYFDLLPTRPVSPDQLPQ